MKLFITILITSLLISCCPKIVPVSSHKIDSVRVERAVEYVERVRDTTIFVPVPAESHSQVVCDSSHLETGVAFSDAWIGGDGLLRHTLANKRVSLETVASVKDTELRQRMDSVVYRDVVTERTVTVKHIPKSYWWLLAIAIVAVGLHIWKIKKIFF